MNDKIVCGHDECGISSLTSLVIKNKHRLKLKAHFDAGVTLNAYARAIMKMQLNRCANLEIKKVLLIGLQLKMKK